MSDQASSFVQDIVGARPTKSSSSTTTTTTTTPSTPKSTKTTPSSTTTKSYPSPESCSSQGECSQASNSSASQASLELVHNVQSNHVEREERMMLFTDLVNTYMRRSCLDSVLIGELMVQVNNRLRAMEEEGESNSNNNNSGGGKHQPFTSTETRYYLERLEMRNIIMLANDTVYRI